MEHQEKKIYRCRECGLAYEDEAVAKQCEAWCKEHKSCNLEIIAHALQNDPGRKIIFVCAENAGRSQMAETYFTRYAEENKLDWTAESAGTFPAKQINPIVIEAMAERGMDLKEKSPKLFLADRADNYEKIISFGCLVKAAFSSQIQERIEEWQIDDPTDKSLEEVRKIRDDIEKKVEHLIEILSNTKMEDTKEKTVGGVVGCENCKSGAEAGSKDGKGGCYKVGSNCCSSCKPTSGQNGGDTKNCAHCS